MNPYAWILFLVAMSSFDALRDVGRGQFEYWVWHTIKWLSMYPPLAYILYKKVWKASKVLAVVAVVLSAMAWNFWADLYRPPHWDDGPSQWVEVIKGFLP